MIFVVVTGISSRDVHNLDEEINFKFQMKTGKQPYCVKQHLSLHIFSLLEHNLFICGNVIENALLYVSHACTKQSLW